MLVFGVFKSQRLNLDVPIGVPVREVKGLIQEVLGLTADSLRQDNTIMVLSYAGANLGDNWILSDLGILPGTTIKIQLKEDIKPVLYIRCSHNQETISVFEEAQQASMKVDQVRSMASMLSGLPVSIFRLTTEDGREMFDSYHLEDYNVDRGHTILMEVWDGWDEFLNLAIMGFTPQVIAQVGGEEVVARYQMKVALFIASHFGHADLARCILKQGVRSDEPTGYHPSRMWCKENGHIDIQKCPVHEATLCGQIAVLRLFVNHDITCLKAKDGHGLEPLNIALRRKVKNCASFLLSKQWTKVNITKTFALRVSTYAQLKMWCQRAKDRALLKYGPSKSSLQRRHFNTGSLVSHGIFVDGFSKSPMTGKTKTEFMKDEKEMRDREMNRRRLCVTVAELLGSTDEPENYFRLINESQGGRLRQRPKRNPLRWQKSSISLTLSKGEDKIREAGYSRIQKTKSQSEGSISEFSKLRTLSIFTDDSENPDYEMANFPPNMQSLRVRRMSKSLKNLGIAEVKVTKGTNAKVTPVNDLEEIRELSFYKTEPSNSSSVNQPAAPRGHLRLVQESVAASSLSQKASSEPAQKLQQNIQGRTRLVSERESLKLTCHTVPLETSISSNADEVFFAENQPRTLKKRKKNASNSFMSLKGKSSVGSITLPNISHEQDRRPFFYHQGLREEQLVDATLQLLAKYKGDSSRERALTSLTLTNSFSEKPWLYRVRLALNLTSNSLKRNVRRLQEHNCSLALN